jgi:hypothetical protein
MISPTKPAEISEGVLSTSDNGHYGAHGKVEGSGNPRLSLLGGCPEGVVIDRWEGGFFMSKVRGRAQEILVYPDHR